MFRAEVIGSMLRPSYLQEGRAAFEQGQLSAADVQAPGGPGGRPGDRPAGGRGRRRGQRRRDAPLPLHGPDHRDGRGDRARRARQRDAVEHARGRRRVDLAGRGDLQAAQAPLDGHRGVQLRAGAREAAAEGDRAEPARALRVLEPEALDRRLRRRLRDVRRRRRDRALGDPGARRAGLRVHPGRRARARHARRPARARLGRADGVRRRAHAHRGHRPHQRDGRGRLGRAPGDPPVPRQQRRDVDGQRRLRVHRPGALRARDGLRRVLPGVRRRPLGLVRAARRRARRQAGRARARVDQDARRSRPPTSCAARIDEAARFFARDQLGLSTQCGFASIAAGNPITEADEERKLRLVADTAHAVWG